MGPHCPIYPLTVNKVHAAVHHLHNSSLLQEFHLSGKEVGGNLQMLLRKKLAMFAPLR